MKFRKQRRVVAQSPDEVRRAIAVRLKALRKSMGYKSAETFAYDHEINRSQYARYEKGKVDIRVGTLTRIVNVMGVSLEEFFASTN